MRGRKRTRDELSKDWVIIDSVVTPAAPAKQGETTLQDRLSLVDLAAQPSFEQALGAELAGRQGEDDVVQRMQGFRGVEADGVFRCVRVPQVNEQGTQRRKHEVDLLYVYRWGIVVIEIKAWSGEVIPDGDSWCQIRRAGRGEIKHPNAVLEVKQKAAMLLLHLSRHGIDVPADCVRHAVVFTNQRVELHPEIAALPEVVQAPCCDGFLATMESSLIGGWISSFLPTWLTAAPLTEATVQEVRAQVAALPTWDSLLLEGGRRLYGDFIGSDALEEAQQDRAEVASLHCEHTRGGLTPKLWAIAGWAPNVNITVRLRPGARGTGGLSSWFISEDPVVKVPVDAVVRFQSAGNREIAEHPLNNVLEVTFGSQ